MNFCPNPTRRRRFNYWFCHI